MIKTLPKPNPDDLGLVLSRTRNYFDNVHLRKRDKNIRSRRPRTENPSQRWKNFQSSRTTKLRATRAWRESSWGQWQHNKQRPELKTELGRQRLRKTNKRMIRAAALLSSSSAAAAQKVFFATGCCLRVPAEVHRHQKPVWPKEKKKTSRSHTTLFGDQVKTRNWSEFYAWVGCLLISLLRKENLSNDTKWKPRDKKLSFLLGTIFL